MHTIIRSSFFCKRLEPCRQAEPTHHHAGNQALQAWPRASGEGEAFSHEVFRRTGEEDVDLGSLVLFICVGDVSEARGGLDC